MTTIGYRKKVSVVLGLLSSFAVIGFVQWASDFEGIYYG